MLEGRERRDDRESRGHEAVCAAQKKSSRGRPRGTGWGVGHVIPPDTGLGRMNRGWILYILREAERKEGRVGT